MLGSDVRVCVACRKPIDPSQIKAAEAVYRAQEAPRFAPPSSRSVALRRMLLGRALGQEAQGQEAQAQVRFPWGVFVVFLVLGSVMTSEGATALGPLRALLVIGAIQVISSIWVFYDAHQKGIPKPLHWGIGSLFFWLPIFSWYLVRRRQPQSACPLIEAGAPQFLRTLLLIFAVTMFLTVLLSLLLGSARGPSPKPNLTQPAGHQGGSIANRRLGSPYSPMSVEPTSAGPVSDGPGFVAKNAVRRESCSHLEFESGT